VRELGIVRTAKETEPVNPQLHAEFVELCAVFYTGELSDEEWALLQIHMAYCDDCRQHFEQYRHVAKELIPAMAAAAAAEIDVPHESTASILEAERQLLESLDRTHPAPSSKPSQTSRSRFLPFLPPVIIAFAAGVIAAVFYHHWPQRDVQHAPVPAALTTASTLPVKQTDSLDTDKETTQRELHSLQEQLADANGKSGQAESAAAALKLKLDEEQSQEAALAAERQTLGNQLSTAQSEIQHLQGEIDSAKGESQHRLLDVANLEGKVRSLSAALEDAQTALNDKERMLALDKDFLSHDRDIRDVIGARNLYIADIFDTTESGKTAKPFGRIFYTQDRSLVFYGFDLEKKAATKHAVAYQVWGSGTDRSPVSLGLFYQDDNHKRWVLRCSDAKTLSRLNMVFVTVEPEGGSRTPTGPQFLRAYLQIQPNHP